MTNIPEWFTVDTAKNITNIGLSDQQSDEQYLEAAYSNFLNLAKVALERQERYPIDNPLLGKLASATGLKREEILKLAESSRK